MTKSEKLEKAMGDHNYALQRIGELENELMKLRRQLIDKNLHIRKLEGTYVPRRPTSNYEASRWEQG